MTLHTPKLAALIASRICHDLISPVGAISNGLELMSLGGASDTSPELSLISESCSNANARIRLFRIAFGFANNASRVSETECRTILDGTYIGGRINVHWKVSGDQPRQEVQLAFLALQCLETTIPHGGQITCARDEDRWRLTATGHRMTNSLNAVWNEMAALTRALPNDATELNFSPAEVQFAMLPLLASPMNRAPAVHLSAEEIVLTV
ncbi:histidine phosphotransferase family protein [Primorskyibacter aestuariivivens]|uniref:histidine phosphotransferase family protein n=1 Tax=Primorskyibacter aestuariivivens TaxID=1888912 RepID=UPI002300C979|nr:histidine phosphotransferase family protein [Primorskyibacter aestuariivivens]MDA7429810.1 histidine phosphotransferase family protein [Primorskyibacter aestuariivivens]